MLIYETVVALPCACHDSVVSITGLYTPCRSALWLSELCGVYIVLKFELHYCRLVHALNPATGALQATPQRILRIWNVNDEI